MAEVHDAGPQGGHYPVRASLLDHFDQQARWWSDGQETLFAPRSFPNPFRAGSVQQAYAVALTAG